MDNGKKQTFTVLGGRVTLLRQAMMPSEDGIWLAACVAARFEGARVLDAFAGTGLVGLCALHHGAAQVTAVDKDADLIGQSMANAALNGWAERWVPVCAGVDDLRILREKKYDVVVGNPPFYAVSAGFGSADVGRAAAHGLPVGALSGWLENLWELVAAGGVLAVILHVREAAVVMTFAHRAGVAVRWIFIETSAQKPAKRVVAVVGEAGADVTIQAWAESVRARVLAGGGVALI